MHALQMVHERADWQFEAAGESFLALAVGLLRAAFVLGDSRLLDTGSVREFNLREPIVHTKALQLAADRIHCGNITLRTISVIHSVA